MKEHIFEKAKGLIIMLAIHLCGTLSLKAVELFNDDANIKFFCLKPRCLPGMIHAKRHEVFRLDSIPLTRKKFVWQENEKKRSLTWSSQKKIKKHV